MHPPTLTSFRPALPHYSLAMRTAIVDIVRAEMGGLDQVDQVVLHSEGVQPGAVSGLSEVGVAILVASDPSGWLESWRIEDRLNQELAGQGLAFEISLLRAAEARKFRRCQNHFQARVLLTGLPLWPDSEAGPPGELPYAEALAETAFQSARRAANWLTQPYRRSRDYAETCAFAYRAACECLKVPLIQADLSVWPQAVRWRLDRLVQMAAWLDPGQAAWVDSPAVVEALRPEYFIPWREQETLGFPRRTETEARAALAAAWRIGRRFAPEAIRIARALLPIQRQTGARPRAEE